MSPFKVIRCRYYADDGKAIPPYCSAGRRCTFLHPGDKGWPGGDPAPVPEVKRPDERDSARSSSDWPPQRLRAWKTSHRADSHSKAGTSKNGDTVATSMIDLVTEAPNPPTRRNAPNSSKDQPAVLSIVQTFNDIAKSQIKITQDRENLDQAIDKLAAFTELSESLSKVSSFSAAAAVNSTLDGVIKTRRDLELKLEEDTRRLSDLWDDVFTVFLRAICRQLDGELEAGTDFLRQEARGLAKLIPKTHETSHGSTSSALDNPLTVSSRTWQSSVMSGPDGRATAVRNTGDTKDTSKEGDELVNPPIGSSDNGWGRKRRRFSSDSTGDDSEHADGTSQDNLRDTIARMQQQLDEQGEQINLLIEQNQMLKQPNNLQSNPSQPTVNNGMQSGLSSPLQAMGPRVFEDLVSHIRRTLQSDILAFISPALENQQQVNEYWGMQLNALAEELKKVTVINSGYSLESAATEGK